MLSLSDDMNRLLQECLLAHRPDLLYLVDSKDLFTVDEDVGNELREAVTDEFIASGLTSADEPNSRGIKLERLIDLIGGMFL